MSGAADRPAAPEGRTGASDVRDPVVRRELKKASAWALVAIAVVLVWALAQPILLILAGVVVASLLDGGVRLLGYVLPIGRGWRLTIVMLLMVCGLAGVFMLAGFEIAAQFGELQETLIVQSAELIDWLGTLGITPANLQFGDILRQVLGSVGSLTSAIGSVIGAVVTLFLILVIGLFVAIDPNLYDRGIQWMLPVGTRREFHRTAMHMAHTLRRLLAGRVIGMVFEGFLTWFLLWILGVPMALLLGILAGLLAFIPNVGAIITGALMVAAGLSVSTTTGLYAFGIYVVVQTIDGYVVIPMVAAKTVDLPPALTLSGQILFAALFGVLGLALADPILAMAKAGLERRKAVNEHEEAEEIERREAEAEAALRTAALEPDGGAAARGRFLRRRERRET